MRLLLPLLAPLSAEQQAALQPHLQAHLQAHSQALLTAEAAPAPSSWPVDEALVAQARQALAARSMAELLYRRMVLRHVAGEQTVLSANNLMGGNAAALFIRPSGRALTEGVPTLYTLQGIAKTVGKALSDEALAEVRRVLGQAEAANDTAADLRRALRADALRLYMNDYISAWDALLADLRLAPVADAAAAERVAARLEAADSPLASLLRNAATQTTPGQQLSALAGGTPLRQVDDHFAALQRLVSGQPPALNAALSLLAQRLRQPEASLATLPALKATADAAPQPLRNLLSQLMPQVIDAAPAAPAPAAAPTTASAAEAAFSSLQQQCQRSAANRYPLVAAAKAEMSLADFNALFGAGSGFDAYFQRWLAPLVDVSTQPWAWRPGSAAQRPVPNAALASFEQAASIRAALFSGGSRQASMSVTLSVLALDDSVPAVELRLNNQPTELRVGQGAQLIAWPGQPALQRISLGAAGAKAPELSVEGAWSLPRLLDALTLQPSRAPQRYFAKLPIGGRPAELNLVTASASNLGKAQLRGFRCPAAAEPKPVVQPAKGGLDGRVSPSNAAVESIKKQLVEAVRSKR